MMGAANMVVVCVKFRKGDHGWLASCGLSELIFCALWDRSYWDNGGLRASSRGSRWL